MKRLLIKIVIAWLLGMSLPFNNTINIFAAYDPEPGISSLIDFRMYYPIVPIEDNAYDIYQKNYLGLDLLYQYYYFNEHFGFAFDPGLLVLPIRRSGSKKKLVSVYCQSGFTTRIKPSFWMDPSLALLAGAGFSDAGTLISSDYSFPFSARGSINLYSTRERFEDSSLALTLSGSANYVASQLKFLSPWTYDVGLALRGSF